MRLLRFLALSVFSISVLAQSTAPQTSTTGTSNPPQDSTQSTQNPSTLQVEPMDKTPTFRVNVVGRTTTAVNYRHRGGATKINFKGTDLMPKANGEAKVESKQGYIEVEVEFDDLDKPSKFGNEYLTYVLWAITPEGRATNLGEVLLNGNRSKLDVTTDLQSFGMIVTAEPYYAVTQPSNLVIMENVIRKDTVGAAEMIDARYELLERGGYTPTGYTFDPIVLNANLPLEFYEARNALRIAQQAKADQYASSTWERAQQLMKQADEYATRKEIPKKPLVGVSREVVQTAEDARAISLRKQDEERIAADKAAGAAREALARAQADEESRRRAQAETDAQASEQRRRQAEDAQRLAQQQSDESRRLADEASKQRAEADAARQAALQQQEQARAEADRQRAAAQAADQARLQAEKDKEALRAKIMQQLNMILETRDTARGLVVNMPDVLFASGQSTLKPIAREKLARLSGILLSYPDLKIEVEGHTDSVGSEAFNQKLSEKRAETVKAYLIAQGVPPETASALGFGESQPVADNASAKGRAQNRRVEMVVSGEVIGTKIGATSQQQLPASDRPKQ
jgi:outer membrane protein OmpA-like peptidoglycan-associated protein